MAFKLSPVIVFQVVLALWCTACPLTPPETTSGKSSTDPVCGDGACDASETCGTCPGDCGACPALCGDGVCNGRESCSTCPDDCGTCTPSCGDGSCNGAETCTTCAADCSCSCGDGVCDPGSEDCTSCPGDCGVCPPSCGDGACNGNESCSSCPSDCGACAPSCGDGSCNGSETCSSCPSDCPSCACGDGSCNGGETCASCPGDCGVCAPACGDGTCNGTETCSSCPSDCGACMANPCGFDSTLHFFFHDDVLQLESADHQTCVRMTRTLLTCRDPGISCPTAQWRIDTTRIGHGGALVADLSTAAGDSLTWVAQRHNYTNTATLIHGASTYTFHLNGQDPKPVVFQNANVGATGTGAFSTVSLQRFNP